MTPTDQELLRQYAHGPSEPAFTTVVERHVNLVYSAALRLTAGDAALAEDITQKVFTDLAHKAAAVARAASVAGWLHTHTRFISLTAIRGERRRRIREQEAFAMHDQNPSPEFNWSQLRPLLDEAVGELRPADRDAVILRFFENKRHREVGDTLGLNENAARMKIERALEKLQAHFVRRGVTVSSAVIATAMSANSVRAAPLGLGSKVAGDSFASATHAGSLAHSFARILFMSTKTKVAITTIIVLLIAVLLFFMGRQKVDELPTLQSPQSSGNSFAAAATDPPTPSVALAPVRPPSVAAPVLPPVPASESEAMSPPAAIPAQPAATGDFSQTSRGKAVTNNLRQLVTAASQYMHDKGVASVAYRDLVNAGYLPPLMTVTGEDYSQINISQTDYQVQVMTPDGITVTYSWLTLPVPPLTSPGSRL